MTMPAQIPPGLLEGSTKPAAKGLFDSPWYYEEDYGSCRLGIKTAKLLHEEQTPFQKISIYDTQFFGKLLTLDGIVQLTERDEFVYHEMLVHVPLCSLPDPKSVLIIGGGDCGCLREVLKHPGIERVVQCDIDERVTRVCEEFYPWVTEAIADSRAQLEFTDGVKYVEQNVANFDLVIIDSTDPMDGSVGLFLRDFYAKVSKSLKPGGLMVAQTESPHWDAPMVGAIHGELRASFAHAAAYLISVPTYPSGLWSLGFASNIAEPNQSPDRQRAEAIAKRCRYYNVEMHQACFALPNFVAEALRGRNVFAHLEQGFESNKS
jgi:spermidine synthase